MFGMIQGSMNFDQIMNILNQNQMMKMMVFTLIQNPMMMNTMMNIMNSLIYNSFLFEQIKNIMNQELNQMNFMNMNNQNLNMINNMNNPINNIKEKKITLIFQKSGYLKKTFVNCYLNDKISNIIEKYRELSDDQDKELKFLFNARTINPLETVSEVGFKNGSLIIVVSLENMRGGKNMDLH